MICHELPSNSKITLGASVRPTELFDEEREDNQNYEERPGQYTDATQITFDMSVIGVELGAARCSRLARSLAVF